MQNPFVMKNSRQIKNRRECPEFEKEHLQKTELASNLELLITNGEETDVFPLRSGKSKKTCLITSRLLNIILELLANAIIYN